MDDGPLAPGYGPWGPPGGFGGGATGAPQFAGGLGGGAPPGHQIIPREYGVCLLIFDVQGS